MLDRHRDGEDLGLPLLAGGVPPRRSSGGLVAVEAAQHGALLRVRGGAARVLQHGEQTHGAGRGTGTEGEAEAASRGQELRRAEADDDAEGPLCRCCGLAERDQARGVDLDVVEVEDHPGVGRRGRGDVECPTDPGGIQVAVQGDEQLVRITQVLRLRFGDRVDAERGDADGVVLTDREERVADALAVAAHLGDEQAAGRAAVGRADLGEVAEVDVRDDQVDMRGERPPDRQHAGHRTTARVGARLLTAGEGEPRQVDLAVEPCVREEGQRRVLPARAGHGVRVAGEAPRHEVLVGGCPGTECRHPVRVRTRDVQRVEHRRRRRGREQLVGGSAVVARAAEETRFVLDLDHQHRAVRGVDALDVLGHRGERSGVRVPGAGGERREGRRLDTRRVAGSREAGRVGLHPGRSVRRRAVLVGAEPQDDQPQARFASRLHQVVDEVELEHFLGRLDRVPRHGRQHGVGTDPGRRGERRSGRLGRRGGGVVHLRPADHEAPTVHDELGDAGVVAQVRGVSRPVSGSREQGHRRAFQ